MKESLHSPASIETKVLNSTFAKVFFAWLLAVTLASCNPDQREIENKLSDVESELLTRGDNQREINREWNIYIWHMWGWDEDEIAKMEEWTSKRACKNRKEYKRLLKKRNRLERQRDKAIANWISHHHNDTYDEHEFENSDDAIIQSIVNRR